MRPTPLLFLITIHPRIFTQKVCLKKKIPGGPGVSPPGTSTNCGAREDKSYSVKTKIGNLCTISSYIQQTAKS